jgi:phospholipid/cholesterol/gamma-HCH transport system permease protein
MDLDTIGAEAGIDRGTAGGVTRLTVRGAWTIDNVARLERDVDAATAERSGRVVLDLSGVSPIDTAGAWLIYRLRAELAKAGAAVELVGASANARRLMEAVEVSGEQALPPPAKPVTLLAMMEAIGRSTANIGRDLVDCAAILGGVTRGIVRSVAQPTRFRFTGGVPSRPTGLQAVPIIFLMSILIGGIIAQQRLRSRYFGADIYAVDLVGVLAARARRAPTAIMLAGGRAAPTPPKSGR